MKQEQILSLPFSTSFVKLPFSPTDGNFLANIDYEDQAIKVNGEIRPLEYSTGFSIDIIAYYKKKDLVLEFTTGFKTIEKLQEKCPNTDWELLKMKVDRCNLIRTIKRI